MYKLLDIPLILRWVAINDCHRPTFFSSSAPDNPPNLPLPSLPGSHSCQQSACIPATPAAPVVHHILQRETVTGQTARRCALRVAANNNIHAHSEWVLLEDSCCCVCSRPWTWHLLATFPILFSVTSLTFPWSLFWFVVSFFCQGIRSEQEGPTPESSGHERPGLFNMREASEGMLIVSAITVCSIVLHSERHSALLVPSAYSFEPDNCTGSTVSGNTQTPPGSCKSRTQT